jgi:hypothetical protein
MNKLTIAVVLLCCVAGCKPTTEITASWKNPDQQAGNGFTTILITAMTDEINARQTVEDELAAALQKKGYHTIKSIDVMPPTFINGKKTETEDLLSEIYQTGADAILSVSLIDQESQVYVIETSLYEADSKDLLWSVQSETYNPKNLTEFSQEFTNVMMAQMEIDSVITVTNTSELATERNR